MSKILRVAADSPVSSVAGAIAGQLRDDGCSVVQAIGVMATYTMIKATILAQRYVTEEGMKFVCVPTYASATINGKQRTALRFTVTVVDDEQAVPAFAGDD